jgi:hypothetical protein
MARRREHAVVTGQVRARLRHQRDQSLDTPIHLTHRGSGAEYMADVQRKRRYVLIGLLVGEYRVTFPKLVLHVSDVYE